MADAGEWPRRAHGRALKREEGIRNTLIISLSPGLGNGPHRGTAIVPSLDGLASDHGGSSKPYRLFNMYNLLKYCSFLVFRKVSGCLTPKAPVFNCHSGGTAYLRSCITNTVAEFETVKEKQKKSLVQGKLGSFISLDSPICIK